MLLDQRFKDESPVKTVQKIQDILNQYGIKTKEFWFSSGVKNCYSLRVYVKDAEYGANGKGMTEEFARASAYAEFMERLQAGYLSMRLTRENHLDYADEVRMSKEECAASCESWIQKMAEGLKELFGTEVPAEFVKMKCFESEEPDGSLVAIPYYNVTKGNYAYFPKKSIPMIYTTNGLAAGNTLEEAFVQGLSEIFERNNVIRCFFGNITPPTIPDEYLRQFEKPYETIQNLRENGLEIILKDCSMGEPFPVVAAVAVDKKRHGYHVHMGSHPVFEIALERSLTEMFQARDLSNVATTTELANVNTKKRSNAELVNLLTKGCGQYTLSFFAGEPAYEFKPFPDRSNMSNAQMLREYVEQIVSKGHELYVRDISHLGFPSVSIFVPGMSEAFPHNLLDQFPAGSRFQKYKDALLHLDELSMEELIEYRQYLSHLLSDYGNAALSFKSLSGKEITGLNRRMEEFLGRMIFAYIEWNFNQVNAIKYAKAAIPVAGEEAKERLSCLCTYYDYLLAGMPEETVVEGLSVLYPEETVLSVKKMLNSGENPFAPYIVHCEPELCAACAYQEKCSVMETKRLIQKVCKAVLKFDNAAAFEKVRAVFKNIGYAGA